MSAEAESWIDKAKADLFGFLRKLDNVPHGLIEMLKDDGQKNLIAGAWKSFFSTSKYKRGEEITPLEFGRIFGHWESLFSTWTENDHPWENLEEYRAKAKSLDEKLEDLSRHIALPPQLVFLRDTLRNAFSIVDPEIQLKAKACLPEFHALCKRIRLLAASQNQEDRDDFQRGYGAAIASNCVGPDGLAVRRDKKAEFVFMLRPRIMEASMTANDLHSLLELLLGQNASGDPESFSRFLRRNEAGVAPHGRPQKKQSILPNSESKKPDKN